MCSIAIVLALCCMTSIATAQSRTFQNVTIERVLGGIVGMQKIDTMPDGAFLVQTDTFDVLWRTSGERLTHLGIRVRYTLDSALRTGIPVPVIAMIARIYGFRTDTMPHTVIQHWNDHLAWLIQKQRPGTVGMGRGYPNVVIHMSRESYYLSLY